MKIERSTRDGEPWNYQQLVTPLLLLGAIGYNAILAMINAFAFRVSTPMAIACEVAIIGAAMVWAVRNGIRKYVVLAYLFIAPFVLISLFVSLVNEQIFPDVIRNILIISSFTALGFVSGEREFQKSVLIAMVIVSIFLALEVFYLPGYVALFQPEQYFLATRGGEAFEFNDTGLFAGALGYSERFSYGIFDGPRTSSIFLEQVSLAGFAAVLTIYIIGNWRRISVAQRILSVLLVVAILVTNNTRASSALVFIFFAGYFLFHRLPARATWLVGPAVLATAFILVGLFRPGGSRSDDLLGRLAITVGDLKEMGADTLLLGSLAAARRAYDSGYVFIIASSTIFGLMLFWTYMNVMPARQTDAQKRVRWAVNIYVWAWLLIGGTAIFTMKTSALLWLTVGNLAAQTVSLPIRSRARSTVTPAGRLIHKSVAAAPDDPRSALT